jgi:hypothetical protein
MKAVGDAPLVIHARGIDAGSMVDLVVDVGNSAVRCLVGSRYLRHSPV